MSDVIVYAGDCHGNVDAVSKIDMFADRIGAKTIVQVGDFAYCWPGKKVMSDYFSKRSRQGNLSARWLTCGGNHEDWDEIDALWELQGKPDIVTLGPDVSHVRRAVTLDLGGVRHLFCGGANSTDREWRIEGQSWWKQEAPSREELLSFHDRLHEDKPEVVITHDAPVRVDLWRSGREHDSVARGLDGALGEGYPNLKWYFGHHHVLMNVSVGSTSFYGCGIEGGLWTSDGFSVNLAKQSIKDAVEDYRSSK